MLLYWWLLLELLPIPVPAVSKAWVCGGSLGLIFGSNPARGTDGSLLSGRGFCVGPITHPEEYYRVWCVRV
jgi:hypothetical protein